jgi:hypothetical protein
VEFEVTLGAMEIETNSPRTRVMARWIVLVAMVALALGAGTFVVARSSVEQAATAELSFNPSAAYRDDSALTHTSQPAVVAAQSMLTQTVVLDLLKRVAPSAGGSAADAADAVGEFRSGLDLEEPSLETLQVTDRDPDPQRARAVTNAVARALAEWTPPAAAPPARKPALPARKPAQSTRKPAAASAMAAFPAWQNPFRVLRFASVAPSIPAEPARVAIEISAFLFAAAAFGGLLFRRLEKWAAYAADTVEGGRAYTLVPPMPVVKPEPELESVALGPEAAGQPVAAEPVFAKGNEPDAQLASAPQRPHEAEVIGAPEPAHPAPAAEPLEAVPVAVNGLVSLYAEAVKMSKVGPPDAQSESAPAAESEPAAESARVGGPQLIEPWPGKLEGIGGGRRSFVDPGGDDGEWSARILQALVRTSVGQKQKAEHPGDLSNRTVSGLPGAGSDPSERRAPEGHQGG